MSEKIFKICNIFNLSKRLTIFEIVNAFGIFGIQLWILFHGPGWKSLKILKIVLFSYSLIFGSFAVILLLFMELYGIIKKNYKMVILNCICRCFQVIGNTIIIYLYLASEKEKYDIIE